jgi:hypothetical protein
LRPVQEAEFDENVRSLPLNPLMLNRQKITEAGRISARAVIGPPIRETNQVYAKLLPVNRLSAQSIGIHECAE